MTTTEAAKAYYANIAALRAGKITPDAHRVENRRLREAVGDADWERAKAVALATDQRLND